MAYTKKDWEDGEVITEAAMDNIENGVSANDTKNITEIYIAPSVNKIAKTAFDGIDNLTIYAEKGHWKG